MQFSGTEYCKLDSNGRFKLPIAFKRQLEEGEMDFLVRESNVRPCLELWTKKEFDLYTEKLYTVLNKYDEEDDELLWMMTDGNNVTLDSADRLVIPPEQKHVLKGSKDIVLRGNHDKIEIWERDTLAATEAECRKNARKRIYQRLGNQRVPTNPVESHE